MGNITKILVTSVSFLILLSGCIKQQNAAPKDEKPAADKVVTLLVESSSVKKYTGYAERVKEATGITLNLVPSPVSTNDRMAKVDTILSSGDSGIDVLNINDEMLSTYKGTGFLEPLQKDVMTPDVLSQFPANYIRDMVSVGEDVFAVPLHSELLALWVNEKKLASAGMDGIRNKEDFLRFVAATSGNGNYGYGGAWDTTYSHNEIGVFVNLFGGDYCDWTNPASRQGVQFLKEMVEKGYTPVSQTADQYNSLNQKFVDGIYGCIFSYGMLSDIPEGETADLHMVPMPKFATDSTYFATWHYVLNKASGNKKNAIRFLQYAASKEGQLTEAGSLMRVPGRADALNDPSYSIKDLEVLKGYMEHTTLRARPMVPKAMDFISVIGKLFQKYIFDEISLDQFCQSAQAAVSTYAVAK